MEDLQKLYEALYLIQQVCEKCDCCGNCPLGYEDGCRLINSGRPMHWTLREPVVRLFEE